MRPGLLLLLFLCAVQTQAQTSDAPLLGHPPVVRETVAPVYPDSARAVGIEGRVHVRVRISATGEIIHAAVLRSDHAALDSAAVQAVRQWRFGPAMRAGQPVEAWITVPIRFQATPPTSTAAAAGGAPVLDGRPIEFISTSAPGFNGTLSPADTARCRLVASPVPVRQVPPHYPDRDRERGNEGRVTLRVLVGADGRVRSVERTQETNARFGQSAQAAVEQWTFTPALCNGQAVEAYTPMPIRFRQSTRMGPPPSPRLPDHPPHP